MSNLQNFKQKIGLMIEQEALYSSGELVLNKLLEFVSSDGLRLAIVKDSKDELTGCNNENDYCDDELKCDGCQYKVIFLEEVK